MAPSKPDALSRREREIMDIILSAGRATASDVQRAMTDPPTNAAVRATLRTLVEKGHLRFQSDGPRYVYTPAVPLDKVRQSAVDRLVETFFEGSTEMAVAALLQRGDSELSPESLERLLDAARKAQREGR